MTFARALDEVLAEVGVSADATAARAMRLHYELLRKWGRRINLTTVMDPARAARRHYGEAAFLHRELPPLASAVDVGSGAGFPGIPFAILRPGTAVTLVESNRRKAAFLMEAAVGLPNVDVRDTRLSEWPDRAEWALLRAVSPTSVLRDLRSRVSAVAILGTRQPPDGPFGPWDGRPLPWGREMRLWIGRARQWECFT